MAKLGDIATYINGYAFKPQDWSDEGIPIIRIQDLTGNSYQANRYNGEYASKYEVNDGDVLISWSASLGVYIWHGEKAVLNQHIFKVVFDKERISKDFFVHQVGLILENAASDAHGATMKHLTKPVFDALPFYLPPYKKQCEIAEVLDKVTSLISLRKQQLAKLDELVKARFVEMFGDFEVNPKEFPVYHLCELCDVGSSKRIYQEEQSISGIPFLKVADLNELIDTGKYLCSTFIPLERYEQLLHKELTPKENDILITSRGTLGKCYIVQSDDEFYFQDGMISWLSNLSPKVSSIYISYLFAQPYIQKQIESLQAGSTVAYLSIAMLKKMNVILPPKKLQDDFATFVEHVDQQKQTVQQSLEKLELMKKALMQEYFG
jgi:type I restriction enzyme ecoEI specificity protein